MTALDPGFQTASTAKDGLRTQFYSLVRNLHLYIGLFLSPFVMVFAVSVILLNHPDIPLGAPLEFQARTLKVELPPGIDKLEGMGRVQQVRPVLRQAGVQGEIGFISHSNREGKLIIPVSRPGYEATVKVALSNGLASITERRTGLWDSLIFLHKMPGPHLINIRGNWWVVRAWAWFADGTAWLLIFLSVSGVYFWAVLRSERHLGLVLMGGGAISLLGALYAICA